MDITAITQVIGSLGFPIVAAVACFYQMGKQEESHKEEMTKITEALNNNTLVIQKLSDRIEEERRNDD